MFLAGALWPQQDKALKTKSQEQAKPEVQEQEPPEEDESLKPKEYSFQSIESRERFQSWQLLFQERQLQRRDQPLSEATLWNPNFAEAYLRLGDSEEKIKDPKGAHEAYAKYLELAPDSKEAASVKKKLAGQR